MRPLIIDDVARRTADRVIKHAKEHPYIPGPGVMPPGDNPSFVAKFGTYRAVFSYTHSDGQVWRHLSISVPSSKYPNPAAAFTIASDLFGFTGWDGRTIDQLPADWLMNVNEQEHCITMAQVIEKGSA